MLTEPTIDKLRGMRLGTMADAWLSQREQPKVHELDFDTRFGLLVDAEHLSRDNKRLARALRAAKLRLPNVVLAKRTPDAWVDAILKAKDLAWSPSWEDLRRQFSLSHVAGTLKDLILRLLINKGIAL